MIGKSSPLTGRNNPGWGLFALWSISIVVGGFIFAGVMWLFIGLLMGVPINEPGFSIAWLFGLMGAVSGAVGGLLIGIGQWLALRGWVDWSGKWIKASVVGWAIAGGIALFLGWSLGNLTIKGVGDVGIPMSIIVASVGLGFGQWLFLRTLLSASAWWILANGLACILGLLAVFLLLQLLVPRTETIASGYVGLFWLLVSLIFGGITWFSLNALISAQVVDGQA